MRLRCFEGAGLSAAHDEKLIRVLSALERAGFGNMVSARPVEIARAMAQLARRGGPPEVYADALELLAGALETSDKCYEIMRDTALKVAALSAQKGEPIIDAEQKKR